MKYLFICLTVALTASAGMITPRLVDQMETARADAMIDIFVKPAGDVDCGYVAQATAGFSRADRREFAVSVMKAVAEQTQAPILESLKAWPSESVTGLHTNWLANFISCSATVDAIRDMASLECVAWVDFRPATCPFIEPIDVRPANPDELSRANAWGVDKIGAPAVWALGYDGEGIVVAVIDTGVNYNHIDLANNMWSDSQGHCGYDFYDNDWDPMDDNDHGTHCAGSIVGDGTGGTQTGVAPGAQCMALRINYYSGGESTWIEAMEFGADNGAAVLSMSLGSTHGNMTLRTAEANLLTAGVFHSVAAANSGPTPGSILSSGDAPPPWFHPQQTQHGGQTAVVTVGATDSNDTVASFSSRGPVTWWSDYTVSAPLIDPDISAPGVNVVSTARTGGYMTMSGTSMATPHVAGVAALMLDANPNLTVAQIDQIMEQTALDLLPTGKDNATGSGRIDALAAVQAALLVRVEESVGLVPAPGVLMSAINPNPVSGSAMFQLYTGEAGRARIEVFDLTGRIVSDIPSGDIASGTHSFIWNLPEGMGNGIYFIRSTVNGVSDTARMTVVR